VGAHPAWEGPSVGDPPAWEPSVGAPKRGISPAWDGRPAWEPPALQRGTVFEKAGAMLDFDREI
jgi:hypothetical protein